MTPRGNTQAVNLRRGDGNVEAAGFSTSVVIASPNSFTVYVSHFGVIADPPDNVITTITVL